MGSYLQMWEHRTGVVAQAVLERVYIAPSSQDQQIGKLVILANIRMMRWL